MRILVVCSVFPPDPAAVGQHMSDVAQWASRCGHEIRVLTADCGYEAHRTRYKKFENFGSVGIIRLPWSSFGKRNFTSRTLGQVCFVIQAFLKGLAGRKPHVILISTTPPIGIAGAWLLARLRHAALAYWIMDINPDQAIIMGMIRRCSLSARVLEKLNRLVLESADLLITLDSDMAHRLLAKTPTCKPISIIPPWSQEDTIEISTSKNNNEFRKTFGLDDKFIVMYSGNHSWVHPLDTILEAARELENREEIRFVFVGQGNEKAKVNQAIERGAINIISLPFQPFESIGESLAAADAHLVVMGDSMVGIVHPCKIYNAMLVGKPILAIAPQNCYISDILGGNGIGMRFDHGDVEGLARGIVKLADMDPEERAEMGRRAHTLVCQRWNQSELVGRLIKLLEESARRGEVSDAR